MSDFTLFLGKFLTQGTKIASLAPSSPWLSRATIAKVDWSRAKTVVELGAGTGPITRAIARVAPTSCRVLVMERDPDFCRLLRDRFSDRANFEIIEADVLNLGSLLADREIDSVDDLISGLPVPSFPVELRDELFRVVKSVLTPSGTFSQITELPWVYLNFYRKFFNNVQFRFEPRNLPPAGVYYCQGVKELPG